MRVTFYDQALFVDTRGNFISPRASAETKVKRQFEEGSESITDGLNQGVSTIIVASFSLSSLSSILMKTNLSRLIGAWKNLNIIMLVTLMDFVTTANGEGLIRRLQEILKV